MSRPPNRTFDSRAVELVAIGVLSVWVLFLFAFLGFCAWWVWAMVMGS